MYPKNTSGFIHYSIHFPISKIELVFFMCYRITTGGREISLCWSSLTREVNRHGKVRRRKKWGRMAGVSTQNFPCRLSARGRREPTPQVCRSLSPPCSANGPHLGRRGATVNERRAFPYTWATPLPKLLCTSCLLLLFIHSSTSDSFHHVLRSIPMHSTTHSVLHVSGTRGHKITQSSRAGVRDNKHTVNGIYPWQCTCEKQNRRTIPGGVQ